MTPNLKRQHSPSSKNMIRATKGCRISAPAQIHVDVFKSKTPPQMYQLLMILLISYFLVEYTKNSKEERAVRFWPAAIAVLVVNHR